MLTRVVAKQAKTTKVKNNLLMEKIQKNTQLSFWVEGEKALPSRLSGLDAEYIRVHAARECQAGKRREWRRYN